MIKRNFSRLTMKNLDTPTDQSASLSSLNLAMCFEIERLYDEPYRVDT